MICCQLSRFLLILAIAGWIEWSKNSIVKFKDGECEKKWKTFTKKEGKQFDEACENFASKSLLRNIPDHSVNEVMNLMKKFGGYAFNKSHSCMYAIVGYWTAYLKYYYPSEWMAACIEADKDDPEKVAVYMSDCERMGVKIMPPNVNHSGYITSVSNDGTIYLPITSLKGIGNSGISIVENQPYTGLDDFMERSGVNKSLFVALTAGGALACLSEEEELDDDYLLDYWELYSKNKSKSKRNNVNNNSLSLLTMKNLENSTEKSGSSLLDALDEL